MDITLATLKRVLCGLILALCVATPAVAKSHPAAKVEHHKHDKKHHKKHHKHTSTKKKKHKPVKKRKHKPVKKPVKKPTPTATPTPTPTPTPPITQGIDIEAYTTGYGWPDNTPPGGAISNPVIHQTAGGTGTYADPITLAVGHSITNGIDTLDYPAGTIFYIPNVRRYFIVEDTCGDGSDPQAGPCNVGFPSDTTAWVDMWVGGQGGNTSAVLNCESFLTDTNGDAHLIIENPASDYVVVSGPLFGTNGACTQEYGNTPV
jgi:Ni/Co efflux regulator RcnB